MRITIDKAGRIVVPKSLRERYNIHAGTELEIIPDKTGIRIVVSGNEPSLKTKKGILIHHGGERVDLDIVSFIQGERHRRGNEIVAENHDDDGTL